MKKLITLLTAAIMAMSMTVSISAEWIKIKNPEDYMCDFVSFEQYGFSGYYNYYQFDGENHYVYNTKTGVCSSETDETGFNIIEKDGVWYMYSRRIEGVEDPEMEGSGMKNAPLAEVLAKAERYEYKLSDMATVQRFFKNQDLEIDIKEEPYLDYNADKKINALDLSLIKYELMH
jgi:hypothetical protein